MPPQERQPYSTFYAPNVQPGQTATQRLSGGKTIPYIYQLALSATVPFIQLVGGAGSQKLLSWNEKIIVPPGEMVTVRNASLHPGDIWISSGWDPSPLPTRVTVPVGLVYQGVPPNDFMSPAFPVDTRRARRAFVGGIANTGVVARTFNVALQSVDRSHDIVPALSDTVSPDAGVNFSVSLPPFTALNLLPLGYQNAVNDPAFTLLDIATWSFSGQFLTHSGSVYYVLEYL